MDEIDTSSIIRPVEVRPDAIDRTDLDIPSPNNLNFESPHLNYPYDQPEGMEYDINQNYIEDDDIDNIGRLNFDQIEEDEGFAIEEGNNKNLNGQQRVKKSVKLRLQIQKGLMV